MFGYIRYQITKLGIYLFWTSKWGAAISLATWDEYRNSILFEERTKHFGTIEAAKLFSHKEFNHFKEKLYKDDSKLSEIIWSPGKVIDRLKDKDVGIRPYVNFGEG